jgi:hypothetical protein
MLAGQHCEAALIEQLKQGLGFDSGPLPGMNGRSRSGSTEERRG